MTQSSWCGCGHQASRLAAPGTAAPWTAEARVGDVARVPGALAVLERFGLNHCCGAHLSLREGAAAAGVAVDDLLRALNAPAPAPA